MFSVSILDKMFFANVRVMDFSIVFWELSKLSFIGVTVPEIVLKIYFRKFLKDIFFWHFPKKCVSWFWFNNLAVVFSVQTLFYRAYTAFPKNLSGWKFQGFTFSSSFLQNKNVKNLLIGRHAKRTCSISTKKRNQRITANINNEPDWAKPVGINQFILGVGGFLISKKN